MLKEPQEMPIINLPLRVIQNPNNKIIDFYLFEEIESVEQYIDFLREIKLANDSDVIQLHINCPGGDINVALNLFDELKESKATVEIYVEGECASAASMILLSGDTWFINNHSYVMVHAWSGIVGGKRNELVAVNDFHKKYLDVKFREMYKDFMTDEEIGACLEGKDFYFTAEEVLDRIKKFQKEDEDTQKAVQAIATKYQDLLNKEVETFMKSKDKVSKKKEKKSTKPKN